MKKLLLSVAILGTALCANADDSLMEFSDCFTVTYKGQELKDGDEIFCTDYQDATYEFGPGTLIYHCEIEVENQDLSPAYMRGVLSYDTPSYRDWSAAPYDWGDATLCYQAVYTPGTQPIGGCLDGVDKISRGQGNVRIPASGVGEFIWDLHLNGVLGDRESRYPLTLTAVSGDEATAVSISKSIRIYINYAKTDSGVDEIATDNGEGVWYDLQGRRVDNPSKGLYIYKTAGKAVKRIVK